MTTTFLSMCIIKTNIKGLYTDTKTTRNENQAKLQNLNSIDRLTAILHGFWVLAIWSVV